MAGDGGDEFAAFLAQSLQDGLGIVVLRRRAGQNDGAGLDIVGGEACVRVGAIDGSAQPCRVDRIDFGERRHGDRRAIECFAAFGIAAHGQRFARSAHHQPREDDLCARRADIDAETDEWHQFEGLRARFQHFMAVIVVIVIVFLPRRMDVIGVGAETMIGQCVRLWRFGRISRHEGARLCGDRYALS